jgi:hypothetical protein
MFEEIKTKELFNQILGKLAQLDTKLSNIDKLLKEKQKPVKSEENKAK